MVGGSWVGGSISSQLTTSPLATSHQPPENSALFSFPWRRHRCDDFAWASPESAWPSRSAAAENRRKRGPTATRGPIPRRSRNSLKFSPRTRKARPSRPRRSRKSQPQKKKRTRSRQANRPPRRSDKADRGGRAWPLYFSRAGEAFGGVLRLARYSIRARSAGLVNLAAPSAGMAG